MPILSKHIVPEHSSRQRLSDYCCGIFAALPSRKSVKKAIRAGRLLLNGKQGNTGDWVKPGMQIDLLAPEKTRPDYELRLEVIHEDQHIALINKPAGIPVSGNQFRTIANTLPFNLKPSSAPDALAAPFPVHRLDSPTSGLLLIAKTGSAHQHLGQAFEQNKIKKIYQAIVTGKPPESGTIELPIEGKPAYTRYELLQSVPSLKNEQLSLLRLFPSTGRTHQIRIHLAQIGHPIMGDKLYGEPGKIYQGKGLFLCATGLQFSHPKSAELLPFVINPPNKFPLLLQREQRMWERYQLGR